MGKLKIIVVLCLTLGFANASSAVGPEALPTSEELHKLYDSGEFQPLLQKLSRVLQLKGPAAQPYDRVDLQMLRGETLLKLKQQSSATEAFDAAVKDATAETPDGAVVARKPEAIALARATDLLVHKSRTFAYTPKVLDPGVRAEPISLLDPDKRKDAFKALLVDTKAELTPKTIAAERSGTLGPIIDLIRNLGDLRAVESTVTGATKDTDAMLATLAERAKTLMSDEIDRVGPKVDTISTAAHAKTRHVNTSYTSNGNTTSASSVTVTYTMRGLYSNDKSDLKSIMGECEKMMLASRDFAQITTGAQSAEFKTFAAKVEKVGVAANTTLNDDYATVNSSPGTTIRR